MLRLQMVRDRLRMLALVKRLVVESDRECFDGGSRVLFHIRNHQRAIDSARQEGANRYVADHAQLDRFIDKSVQLIEQLFFTSVIQRRIGGHFIEGPVANFFECSCADTQIVARLQFANGAVARQWRRYVSGLQIESQGLFVKLSRQVSNQLIERARARRERKNPIPRMKIQRLYPNAVARKKQAFLNTIPDGKRKHPGEFL